MGSHIQILTLSPDIFSESQMDHISKKSQVSLEIIVKLIVKVFFPLSSNARIAVLRSEFVQAFDLFVAGT